MEVTQFATRVMTLCLLHQGSVISWGRSILFNSQMNGHPNSLHLAFLAVDIHFETEQVREDAKLSCQRLGLSWMDKEDFVLHVQAMGIPPNFPPNPSP